MHEIKAEFAMPLLAAYAGAGNPDDFCKHFTHKVLRCYQAVGTVIGLVGSDSKCHSVGKFGEWQINNGGSFDLWASTPIAESIKTGKPVLLNNLRSLEERFSETDSFLVGAKSYIYAPFETTSRAIGFLGVGFAHEDRPLELSEIEIQMASMAAEYISMSVRRVFPDGSSNVPSARQNPQGTNELTNRQLVILQLMSEGLTNQQIGRKINLSESSIKQESVRIFRKLGVGNRIDATELASRNGLV